MMKGCQGFVILIFVIGFVQGSAPPKKFHGDERPFLPSSNRYYELNLPNNTNTKPEAKSKEDKLRFGVLPSTYGTSGTGYSVSNTKIDLGGVALGALIGLGVILLIPKLAHIFGGSYGSGGYRSLEDEMSPLTDLLARIDNSLEQHNIDSSSCMQRIVCSYVYEARKNMESGAANTVDQLIFSLTNNTLLTFMLDGSAIKQAIDMGRQNTMEQCENLYTKCPISKENVMKVIATLLP